MDAQPDFDTFAVAYAAGKAQVVSASLVADLETPVSALIKLADGRPYSFLLESVTGGAVRGRYSILGIKPDLIWRCRGEKAEINRRARYRPRGVRALPRAVARQLAPDNCREPDRSARRTCR